MTRNFIIHKPFGVLSQFINNKIKKKVLLSAFYDFPEGTMAIGRLDHDSEGLLLLTTDGKVSRFVNGSKVEKEYYAQVDGVITDLAIQELQNGVELVIKGEKYTTQPCEVRKIIETPQLPERSRKIRDERHGPTSWVSIVLKEGKNRQVRKMTATVGFPTLRLVRVRIGNIQLKDFESGEVKEVEIFDV